MTVHEIQLLVIGAAFGAVLMNMAQGLWKGLRPTYRWLSRKLWELGKP